MAVSRADGSIHIFFCVSTTTCSSIRIEPRDGFSSPAIQLRRVLFPQPLGPRSTKKSPGLTDREIDLKTSTLPLSDAKYLCRFLISTEADLPYCVSLFYKRGINPQVSSLSDSFLKNKKAICKVLMEQLQLSSHRTGHKALNNILLKYQGQYNQWN